MKELRREEKKMKNEKDPLILDIHALMVKKK